MNLHDAAQRGDLDAIRHLLDSGAEIDSRVSTRPKHGPYFCQLTPLHLAAQAEQNAVEAVRLLVERGADLHAVSEAGASALHYAAIGANREAVRYLIDLGLDVHQQTFSGATPLIVPLHGLWEAAKPDVECLRLLIDAGARINMSSGLGYSPVHLASRAGAAECVRLLIQHGAPVDDRDERGRTPLMIADSAEVVRDLLEAGADPLALEDRQPLPIPEGFTDEQLEQLEAAALPQDSAIELAVERTTDALQGFVDHGLNPLDHGSSAELLQRAISAGSLSSLQVLLSLGASPHEERRGQLPLHFLRVHKEDTAAIARVLVEAGADVEARDSSGRTPLHRAVESSSPDTVRLLLELGADVDSTTRGSTAVGLAREKLADTPIDLEALGLPRVERPDFCTSYRIDPQKLDEVIERFRGAESPTLEKIQEEVDQWLSERYEWQRIAVAEEILARLEGRTNDCWTQFDLADTQQEGQQAVVEALEKAGADARSFKTDQHTPLTQAIVDQDFDRVDKLIAAGASVEEASREGSRPLHCCSEPSKKIDDACTMIRKLHAAGAQLDARQGWGGTPLLVAAYYGRAPQVETLLSLGANPNTALHSDVGPLHLVCSDLRVRDPDSKVALLLQHGADSRHEAGPRASDRTALAPARQRVAEATRKWEQNGKPERGPAATLKQRWLEVVRLLEEVQ